MSSDRVGWGGGAPGAVEPALGAPPSGASVEVGAALPGHWQLPGGAGWGAVRGLAAHGSSLGSRGSLWSCFHLLGLPPPVLSPILVPWREALEAVVVSSLCPPRFVRQPCPPAPPHTLHTSGGRWGRGGGGVCRAGPPSSTLGPHPPAPRTWPVLTAMLGPQPPRPRTHGMSPTHGARQRRQGG